MVSMGLNMAGQIGQHQAETSAARGRNNAKLKNYHRQVKEQDVQANLDKDGVFAKLSVENKMLLLLK